MAGAALGPGVISGDYFLTASEVGFPQKRKESPRTRVPSPCQTRMPAWFAEQEALLARVAATAAAERLQSCVVENGAGSGSSSAAVVEHRPRRARGGNGGQGGNLADRRAEFTRREIARQAARVACEWFGKGKGGKAGGKGNAGPLPAAVGAGPLSSAPAVAAAAGNQGGAGALGTSGKGGAGALGHGAGALENANAAGASALVAGSSVLGATSKAAPFATAPARCEWDGTTEGWTLDRDSGWWWSPRGW